MSTPTTRPTGRSGERIVTAEQPASNGRGASERASDDAKRGTMAGLSTGEQATIELEKVSKWYGDIVAVSDVTFGIGPGITGLLGPNGAGKSTTLKMMAGLQAPSTGRVTIEGQPARGRPTAYRNLGLVSEHEVIYPFLTGREFVRLNARLQKVPRLDEAVERVIDLVDMQGAAQRKVGGYSKGMRQRIKVAGALVHNPDVILMDEPLNGTDPVQRAHLIRLIRDLGDAGKTVVVSSHVLVEVERFAQNILVIINGKLAAAGDFRAIRDRIDEHDHEVRIRASDPRRLAAALIGQPMVLSVRIDHNDRIIAATNDVRTFYQAVPVAAQRERIRLYEIQATDESLTSVFSYLMEQ
ncbi:MAG: Efflux ABC transporter, ATP-binding protein [uncultured Thermomicrobiales bacterium]|uniref:Efflux ABC transporter, ATP-binding protein n=1 Tax=uncultured Thermomicrobiales bacterium TaxID=1645740 RepID=A0A6J4USH6_9BACT|nr:MAG: Efflux ABC transporter, ATP-binding protein [uncultured Thermomicrobiales bacterium]